MPTPRVHMSKIRQALELTEERKARLEALTAALLGQAPANGLALKPMTADRARWEHIHRVLEFSGYNISEAARRLGLHRRTLQRILAKRAPR